MLGFAATGREAFLSEMEDKSRFKFRYVCRWGPKWTDPEGIAGWPLLFMEIEKKF